MERSRPLMPGIGLTEIKSRLSFFGFESTLMGVKKGKICQQRDFLKKRWRMPKICILGGGKIGSLIATFLVECGDFEVVLGDVDPEVVAGLKQDIGHEHFQVSSVDVQDGKALGRFIDSVGPEGIISCLPYFCNQAVGGQARACGAHYFDLTEDVEVTRKIREVSEGASSAFVPQCGLAPGFISIVAHELMTRFDTVDIVKMRVGALPVNPSNVLKYSLTWSTDGLINEYGNTCYGIENSREVPLFLSKDTKPFPSMACYTRPLIPRVGWGRWRIRMRARSGQ